MTDLWRAPAHQMLDALSTGAVTSEELVGQCLARIHAVNPAVNAVVVDNTVAALAEARGVDAARARGDALGPLAGLPFTAKLDYDVAGQATSQGTIVRRDAVADADGPMIGRMRAAGAVLIGRTNQSDFGIVYHTNSSLYGLTRNPWDGTRSAGGSSGGEGAAVACGMSPLGLGSDIGGSIRGPASFNGVAGFKPGLGRYADHSEELPEPPIHEQLFTARGPLARSVRDLILADSVLRGIDPIDPWSAPFLQGAPSPGRVGVIYSPTDTLVPDGILSAVDAAAEALRARGYEVEETKLTGWPELLDNFVAIMQAGFGGDPSTWHLLHEDTQYFLEHVASQSEDVAARDAALGTALARRHRLAVEFNAFHQQYDVLLMPTWCDQPFVSGTLRTAAGIDATIGVSRHLYIFNLLGLPAASVPVAVVDGLPVGVHVSSMRYRDDTVLQAALDIEEELGTFTPVTPS